ncbi:MAG: MFS transporter [Clostridiales bacterium]|nr:MFS transporter [Clostridiales bacterium]
MDTNTGNNVSEPTAENIPMHKGLPKGYENKMVIILAIAFGFVLFDRFAIANLQNYIIADLGIDYTQLGIITSVFSVTWAVVGLFGGYIADTKMSRKVLLGIFVLLFSVCSLLTGVATGFIMLLVIRAVMGVFEGPIMPISQSFIIPQSTPSRRGMNIGIMQVAAAGAISSLAGPLVQVGLANSIGWRMSFVITIIPGIIIAIFCFKVLINPNTSGNEYEMKKRGEDIAKREKVPFWKILNHRNIILSMVGTIFLLCWYVCTLTFMPGYLTVNKGFTNVQMSEVMSAFGVGSVVWGVLMPKLSDLFGRKTLVIICSLMGLLSSFGIILAPANLPVMLVIAFFGWGGVAICALMQATIPAESGDPRYTSTILGANQLTGELIGSTVGAIILGRVGDAYGLQSVIFILGLCMVAVLVISLFYKETAPLVVARRQAAAAAKLSK